MSGENAVVEIRHAPPGYKCFFCDIAAGRYDDLTTQDDIVLRTESMTALVSSHWWPANPGHVLVIPNRHIENIYEFPADLGGGIMDVTRRVAIAMKVAYRCEGISTRQHNEPAGYQDAGHFHQHVFPRWTGDRLYERHAEKALASPALRRERATALRLVLEKATD